MNAECDIDHEEVWEVPLHWDVSIPSNGRAFIRRNGSQLDCQLMRNIVVARGDAQRFRAAMVRAESPLVSGTFEVSGRSVAAVGIDAVTRIAERGSRPGSLGLTGDRSSVTVRDSPGDVVTARGRSWAV